MNDVLLNMNFIINNQTDRNFISMPMHSIVNNKVQIEGIRLLNGSYEKYTC